MRDNHRAGTSLLPERQKAHEHRNKFLPTMTTASHMITEEHVILVDFNDHVIGSAEKKTAHLHNLLHRAFSIFIMRHREAHTEVLLQQRALNKYHSGGLWTNACCSHPRPDETIKNAAERRLKEELGIKTMLTCVGYFHYHAHFSNGLHENEIDHIFIGTLEQHINPTPNPQEVLAYRWVEWTHLNEELKRDPHLFTPWFEQGLSMVADQCR